METEIVRPQSHQEWLELRENGIGSSEIGTIAGLNPYETPYQLWRRRVGIDAPRPETFAMRMGHILEPIVGSLWQDETACEIIPESKGEWFVRRADRPYLFASPDFTFRYPGGAGEIGILECKTTQRAVDPDDIPPAWFCQVQYQLGVAGYARGAIAWLSRGSDFGHVPIDFNPAFFEWLAALADTFYNVNIRERVAPDMLTGRDAALRFSGHEPGAAVEASPEVFETYRRLLALRAQGKEIDAQIDAAEDTLKLAIAGAETLTHDGRRLATWKAARPVARFDAKAFQADHPDLYARYTREGAPVRRFLLKES